jgi:uncharacterized damage-inducible protein DinB
MEHAMTDLRYPIGKFQKKEALAAADRAECIRHIGEAPGNLRAAIAGLSAAQLATPYRPEGWSVGQVVNHVADSHLNAYIRFKLALTEDQPPIKTYRENVWAELIDGRTAPPEQSLMLLDALHFRWVMLLRSLSEADLQRTFVHPDAGVMKLDFLLQLYAWHGQHHAAHITSLRSRSGW